MKKFAALDMGLVWRGLFFY